MIRDGKGKVLKTARLDKIYVVQDGDDCRVSRVVLINDDGSEECVPTRSLQISLGPSMRRLQVKDGDGEIVESNMLKKMMWASGSSNILMVKVDPSKVPSEHLTKFRDHVDAHNKHIVRLGEKNVVIGGKKIYHVCAAGNGWRSLPG